jgi:hypothetical protein
LARENPNQSFTNPINLLYHAHHGGSQHIPWDYSSTTQAVIRSNVIVQERIIIAAYKFNGVTAKHSIRKGAANMDEKHPPGSPPSKPKKLRLKEPRAARRDSQSKPGAPPGPQLPVGPIVNPTDSPESKELVSRYADSRLTETPLLDLLAPLISESLPAPELEKGLDPNSISLKRAREGIHVLIPSSACLLPGDTLNLMWGSKRFRSHAVNEEKLEQEVLAIELVIHSQTHYLQQGHVKVCYDVYRDGQRIGTSAILDVYLHDTYLPGDKQQIRKLSILRKQQRKSPQKR